MEFDVVTLFPGMFVGPLDESVQGPCHFNPDRDPAALRSAKQPAG